MHIVDVIDLKFPKGASLVLDIDDTPREMFEMAVVLSTGSFDDGGHCGQAHLAEHLVLHDNALPRGMMQVGAHTDRTTMTFRMTCRAKDAEYAVEKFLERLFMARLTSPQDVRHAAIEEARFRDAQREVIVEIEGKERDAPSVLASVALYGARWHHDRIYGKVSHVRAVSFAATIAWMREYLTPHGAAIVCSGSGRVHGIREIVENITRRVAAVAGSPVQHDNKVFEPWSARNAVHIEDGPKCAMVAFAVADHQPYVPFGDLHWQMVEVRSALEYARRNKKRTAVGGIINLDREVVLNRSWWSATSTMHFETMRPAEALIEVREAWRSVEHGWKSAGRLFPAAAHEMVLERWIEDQDVALRAARYASLWRLGMRSFPAIELGPTETPTSAPGAKAAAVAICMAGDRRAARREAWSLVNAANEA